MKKYLIVLSLMLFANIVNSQAVTGVKIALLKYRGGGDWYADPTALPRLIDFCNKNMGTSIFPEHDVVDVGSLEIFNYPFLHMTGHGNVIFSEQEAENLRKYLLGGGFLHIDDNYGMDEYIRPQLKKVFPDLELVELPYNHPIYRQKYDFPEGLPKIHEHDGKPAQGFGYIVGGRLVLFYTYQSDISDGWEDPLVHGDSEQTRQKALKMGANIISYVFSEDVE